MHTSSKRKVELEKKPSTDKHVDLSHVSQKSKRAKHTHTREQKRQTD